MLSAAPLSAQNIPTPESAFGFSVGADRKLFDYEQSIDYFRRLARASRNIRLMDVGKTSFGRPWTIAVGGEVAEPRTGTLTARGTGRPGSPAFTGIRKCVTAESTVRLCTLPAAA